MYFSGIIWTEWIQDQGLITLSFIQGYITIYETLKLRNLKDLHTIAEFDVFVYWASCNRLTSFILTHSQYKFQKQTNLKNIKVL